MTTLMNTFSSASIFISLKCIYLNVFTFATAKLFTPQNSQKFKMIARTASYYKPINEHQSDLRTELSFNCTLKKVKREIKKEEKK